MISPLKVEDCYLLGSVGKPHGIKGDVKAFFDVMYIEDYLDKESVYLHQSGKLTPFFIEEFRILSNREAILKFKGFNTRNDAETLRAAEIYLPLDELPDLEEGEFFYHEIVGFTVVDEKLGTLGTVLRVDEMPAQDLIVMNYNSTEVLIPITDDFVLGVDFENNLVNTNLPEGLVGVFDKKDIGQKDDEN